MDSDVIAHNYEGEWDFEQEKIYDLIFYERWFNGEGGFQLEFESLSRVINHMICYNFSALIGAKIIFKKKSFTRFALQSSVYRVGRISSI